LRVAPVLSAFVDDEVLPSTGLPPDVFWSGVARIVAEFAPRNRALLARREELQAALDAHHRSRPGDPSPDIAWLRGIGYLVDEPVDQGILTEGVDEEISHIAGPQLVVPVTMARYAVNAANARWGSLYDALYGTDALGDAPSPGPYDAARGARVIAWARGFLDGSVPLRDGSHADATAYRIAGGGLVVERRGGPATGPVDPAALVGHTGPAESPTSVLLRHHGLHIELVIDRSHAIGADDAAGIADVVLEAAVTAIMDCEDSVATVDATDKVHAYRNWLGLMRSDLTAEVPKGGGTFTRRMADDRRFVGPDGTEVVLPGRALMLVRNVGLLTESDAVVDDAGRPIPEGILDAIITVACAVPDLRGPSAGRNSRHASVYVVKPKLHGPDEVAFTDALFGAVEDLLALPRHTVKLGIMDEERRTSANLRACIGAARHRIAFINTGFLDRTGDEIHTAMEAGAVVRKAEMRARPWIRAYEDRNVDIGLACGFAGRAQIGKGMWAAPDRMAAMLAEKGSHPEAGASCAWVPSPTAATLHATHYHRIDVAARQRELAGRPIASLEDLLTLPLAPSTDWSDDERLAELENNAQGILGYVVRWIDQGIGCSKVPDIHGVALMEDRATCRISSQHIANWLRHGIITVGQVDDVFRRMARVVDEQNATDPAYRPMAPAYDGHAFRAALDLALLGAAQPSGYTEPILHERRADVKRSRGLDSGG